MNEYIKSDLYRYCGRTGAGAFWKVYASNPAFRYMVAHRLVNSAGSGKLIGKLLWIFRSRQVYIPAQVKIGYGLYIGHFGMIVINPTAVIGNNCNITHATTIGANEGRAAVIGDNVYIGPNTCIVENVKIGSSSTIGAGSVVVKDVPENATVAGNYAKILNYDSPGRFIKNPWPVNDSLHRENRS